MMATAGRASLSRSRPGKRRWGCGSPSLGFIVPRSSAQYVFLMRRTPLRRSNTYLGLFKSVE